MHEESRFDGDGSASVSDNGEPGCEDDYDGEKEGQAAVAVSAEGQAAVAAEGQAAVAAEGQAAVAAAHRRRGPGRRRRRRRGPGRRRRRASPTFEEALGELHRRGAEGWLESETLAGDWVEAELDRHTCGLKGHAAGQLVGVCERGHDAEQLEAQLAGDLDGGGRSGLAGEPAQVAQAVRRRSIRRRQSASAVRRPGGRGGGRRAMLGSGRAGGGL